MKKLITLLMVTLSSFLWIGCSTIENSFEAEDPNKDRFNSNDGDDRGGAQFETAIWSSDPKKKTLPKALGSDGKEK